MVGISKVNAQAFVVEIGPDMGRAPILTERGGLSTATRGENVVQDQTGRSCQTSETDPDAARMKTLHGAGRIGRNSAGYAPRAYR